MDTILEIVVIDISEPIQMNVISVYRPPSTPIDVFINHMLEIIDNFNYIKYCCTILRLQGLQQMVNRSTNNRPCLCVTDSKYNANRCHKLLLESS